MTDDFAEIISELRTMHQEGNFELRPLLHHRLLRLGACLFLGLPILIPSRLRWSRPAFASSLSSHDGHGRIRCRVRGGGRPQDQVPPRVASRADPDDAVDAGQLSNSSNDSTPRPAGQLANASLSQDSEVLVGVDRLIERKQKTENMVNDDRGPASSAVKADAGSLAPDSAKGPLFGGPPGLVPKGDSADLSQVIERLEKEAANPREAALQHLRRFQQVGNFVVGGDTKVRIAPTLIAKLYKSGRTAVKEMEETLRTEGLEKCHSAAELPTLAWR